MTALSSSPRQRRVRFDYPAGMDPVWTPTRPEFSCAANSVSLMMPTLEPYFIRSARAALEDLANGKDLDNSKDQDRLEDPDNGNDLDDSEDPDRLDVRLLVEQARAYVDQEARHHHQHLRFNRLLRQRYRHVPRLERAIDSWYGMVERRGSRQFNTALAAASETMAYSAARWAADHRTELFHGADDVASTLFLWHLAEEVEHKAVAFDIYWRCYRDSGLARTRYLAAMTVALALMVVFVISGTAVMLAAERRLFHPLAWIRLMGWGFSFAFELLTNLTLSLLPGHHPSKFADPRWYEVWLAEFDAESGTLPLWNEPGSPPS